MVKLLLIPNLGTALNIGVMHPPPRLEIPKLLPSRIPQR